MTRTHQKFWQQAMRDVATALCVSALLILSLGHQWVALAEDVARAPTKTEDIVTLGDLTISGGFTRAMPSGARSGGGFLTIANAGNQADRLISVSSPNATLVELHEMRMQNDVMIMRPQADGINIPAGEIVTLKPGGLHIMFMQVTTPFVKGENVPVTLTFDRAGMVDVMLPVAGFGARRADDLVVR